MNASKSNILKKTVKVSTKYPYGLELHVRDNYVTIL